MIPADPIVHSPFEFGPFTGFGLAVFMGFWIAQVIGERELRRRGHHAEAISMADLVFAALVGTLIGAKLYYVLIITRDFSDLFTRGGFVFWGGFIGSVVLCTLVVRHKRQSFMRYADVAGIAIAGGYGVGRSGCWAVGDDYGRPWDGPLAVAFPNGAPPSTAGVMYSEFGVPIPAGADLNTVLAVHPTNLYETFLGLLMFLVIWRLRSHRHAEGWLFGVYCVLAGAERFFIEFFRAKDDRFFGPLTAAQVIALAVAAVGIAIMVLRTRPGPGRPGIYGEGRSSAPASDPALA